MKVEIKKLVDEALENDSLSELLGAIHEAMKSHAGGNWVFPEDAYPVMRENLKRHGSEATYKIGTYFMMVTGLIERLVAEEKSWKLYRDETRAEHQERNRKEKIAEAERNLESVKRLGV